ncbi:Uncharacterised protein [Candidatus Bilamarchaeum dharawalense]|uniref:Uncharacterized protein n=1 Tax=Candidatus Bilamarchaeum dharawalense TaxID=2885759 RepID=A0A5E4LTQ4_9ARCH|nr:Uncharacterised protein [Candidatus Bilamarchaeum dharawalense]
MDQKLILIILVLGLIVIFGYYFLSITTSTPDDINQTLQNEIAGKNFETLRALGIPLECDISTSIQNRSITLKIYMRGREELRTELQGLNPKCNSSLSVFKSNTHYLGCIGGKMFQDCDWVSIPQNNYTINSTYQGPDLSGIPPSKIDCRPWLYDPSKFATPGKVCSMEDLFKNFLS